MFLLLQYCEQKLPSLQNMDVTLVYGNTTDRDGKSMKYVKIPGQCQDYHCTDHAKW